MIRNGRGRTRPPVEKYTLRNIDADLWRRVKERTASEGRSIRFVVLALLRLYAEQGFSVVEDFGSPKK